MKYFRSRQYPIELVISEDINKEFSSHNHANHYIISLCIKGSITAILKDKALHLEENAFKKIVGISPTEYLKNCLEITCD